MTKEEKYKIDYENTLKYIFHLSDIRFKLLGLVPFATGIAFSFSEEKGIPVNSFVIGFLGLIVTVGIIFYDQRNTEIYNGLIGRAKDLEKKMLLECANENEEHGGTFTNRAIRSRKLFGRFSMWHDKGLSLVYSVVLWVWMYIVVASSIKLANKEGDFEWFGIAIPTLIALIMYFSLMKLDKENQAGNDKPK
ncbi:MAG: hypothetical protein KDC61_16720 [Saprospiraceae bacterium]|nr:hypothetical protein [Saprospiraceae bacterium]